MGGRPPTFVCMDAHGTVEEVAPSELSVGDVVILTHHRPSRVYDDDTEPDIEWLELSSPPRETGSGGYRLVGMVLGESDEERSAHIGTGEAVTRLAIARSGSTVCRSARWLSDSGVAVPDNRGLWRCIEVLSTTFGHAVNWPFVTRFPPSIELSDDGLRFLTASSLETSSASHLTSLVVAAHRGRVGVGVAAWRPAPSAFDDKMLKALATVSGGANHFDGPVLACGITEITLTSGPRFGNHPGVVELVQTLTLTN